MHALKETGFTINRVSKTLGWDFKTVQKYLRKELSQEERERLRELVERIREVELTDLTLIGAKARAHLHKLLDEGKMKPIETIAAMDRAFQQRRLLEGVSTQNISFAAHIVAIIKAKAQIKERIAAIEAILAKREDEA